MLGEGGAAPSPGLAKFFSALAAYRPGPDVGQDLIQLAHFRHRLDLLMSGLAADMFKSGLWEEEGYTTPIQWLRHEAKLATGVACQQLEVGFTLGSLSKSVEALEQGEIGFGHLAAIADTAGFLGEDRFDEEPFLAKARVQNVTEFGKTCDHLRHAQDPKGFAESERESYEARFLKLSPLDGGGILFKGYLDPENGSLFRSALEPLARKSGAGDERTREQRLADALIESTTGEHQVELVVTCTQETLEGRPGSPAAETEWGGLLSSAAVERILCAGACLRRMLLNGEGVIIDFGRSQRLLSPQGKRAVAARDKHCVWPGCDRPARWCDTHHRQWWQHGGRTTVGDSELLCRRHHHLRHEGWKLVRDSAGGWKALPP